MAVLSGRAAYLEEMAEPPDARENSSVARIRKTSGAASFGASPDNKILDRLGESCLRNPLREIRTVGSVGGASGNRRAYLELSAGGGNRTITRREANWILIPELFFNNRTDLSLSNR